MKNTEYYKSGRHSANAKANAIKNNQTKIACQYCSEERSKPNIAKHETSCYLNPLNKRKCKYFDCNKLVTKNGNQFCSKSCAAKHNNPQKVKPDQYMKEFDKYCWQARFTFNLGDFPEEFDLKLLTEYRMFNSNTNITGLSRDHMYSKKEGFLNKIDPKLLAHPANCELLPQNGIGGNSCKHATCSIAIEELYERIELWEEKYKSI